MVFLTQIHSELCCSGEAKNPEWKNLLTTINIKGFLHMKDKFKKRLALVIAILMFLGVLVGAIAPVVFAETRGEEQKQEQEEDKEETEDDEDEDEDEEENPPIIMGVYPESVNGDRWFNENLLYHDIRDSQTRGKYFLKVTFDNTDNDLEFNGRAGLSTLMNTAIYSDSSNISMLDVEFLNDIAAMEDDERQLFIDRYIFRKDNGNKRAYLYIPIKPLMAHMTYSVTLEQGMVYKGDSSNGSFTWNFNTMAEPSVTEDDILIQSVIEDYDVNEPIIIRGEFFYSPTIEVYFNDIRADRVRIRRDDQNGEYLEVYLPRRRDKLRRGMYSITVENSYDHSKYLYGTLSVVGKSYNRLPEEKDKYGINTPYGIISGYSSMEAIRLDHSEPVKDELLKKHLTKYNLKSPIIEVDSKHYNTYMPMLIIPIDQGEYENYDVLKYSDFSRAWEYLNTNDFYIDKVDQRAIITGVNSGIFVVVERKY